MAGKPRLQSVLLGLLIGLSCIAILLRQVDLKQSWSALGRLNGPYLFVPLAMFCLNLPLRALRWQLIFSRSSRPGFGISLTTLGIGNMANFLLPGRAGDLARCVLLDREASIYSSSRILATLAVEKVLDGLALIGMVLLAIAFLHPPAWMLVLLRLAALLFGGMLAVLLALRFRTQALINAVRRAFGVVHLSSLESKFDGLLTSFADGLSAVSSATRMAILFFLTAAIWATEATLVWGLAASMSLGATLKSSVVASAILGLGLMIPAAPGGLGTYELFGTEAFKLTGMAASNALALTVVIHAWVFVTNVAAGICLLLLKGVSLRQLRSDVEVESTAETPIRPSG